MYRILGLLSAAGVGAGLTFFMDPRLGRGVRGVENRLGVHETPGSVPGLQGPASPRFGAWEFAWMQTNWSPTARLLAGAAGGGLALAGLARIGVIGFAMIVAGTALLVRAVTNQELREILGSARSLTSAKIGVA